MAHAGEMVTQLTLADLVHTLTDWCPENLVAPVYPVIDSRRALPGAVFFAFRGERVDGHAYVGDALSRGAVAAVVERAVPVDADVDILDLTQAWIPGRTLRTPLLIVVPDVLAALQRAARRWRQRFELRIIGITGSVGKTTTKELVAHVLARRYTVERSQQSYNNEIGLPLTLLRLAPGCERLVLEMGMYVRGDLRFLAEIARPEVGVITNVAPVHAERAGSVEEIALGKRELVEALPPAPRGVAILNGDDPRVRAMAEHTAARVFVYGLGPGADLWADGVESRGLDGIRLRLHHQGATLALQVPYPGRHSVYAVLRAAAVGLVEGLAWDEIGAALETPGPIPRMVTTAGPDDTLILDDTYNSSPPSALAALALLEDLAGRKVAVLGDMLELGDYARAGHLEVGRRAGEVVSELICVGELGRLIGEGARQSGLAAAHIHAAADNAAAVTLVRSLSAPGDVILVKGSRGLAMEEIVRALTPAAAGEDGA